jgi:hypothetical protein
MHETLGCSKIAHKFKDLIFTVGDKKFILKP